MHAPAAAEDDLHEQVARALAILLLPPTQFSTFPAGGYQLTEAAKARLSRLGMASGWPDILIVAKTPTRPDGGIWGIELKASGGRLSKTRLVRTRRGGIRIAVGQEERFACLEAAGMPVAVCQTLPEVLAALRSWGIPLRRHA